MDQERFEQCVRSFIEQDYEACARTALDMVRFRANLHLLQLLLISLRRQNETALLDQLTPQILQTTRDHPWIQGLLLLTLGQADPQALWAQADNDEARCQFLFYLGAAARTAGATEQAQEWLAASAG